MTAWFERVELEYGRHGGSFRLVRRGAIDPALHPDLASNQAGDSGAANGSGNGANGSGGVHDDRASARASRATAGKPFVILGPNGAGKSTLMEAPLRALFGFKRNRKAGRESFGQRKPWVGGPYRALVVVGTPQGRFTFDRDFETDRIRVTEKGRQAPLFDAEANPSRAGEAVMQYREILREVIGLDSFDHYRDTGCVFQGGLLATGLSVELLRVAAGGHADVESAHARLRKEYSAITVEPIAPGMSRRRKAGQLERLTEDIAALETLISEVRASEERRAPLVRAREECVVELARLGIETERLETVFETLSEGHRLDTEIEAVRARIRGLERAEHELDEALAGFNLIVAREDVLAALYPLDFAERARALEEGLWPRRADVREESARLLEESEGDEPTVPPRAQFGVAAAVALAGAALAATGTPLVGLLGLIAGLIGGGLLYTRARGAQVRAAFRASRLQDLAGEGLDLDERIARLTADVPDGPTLGPDTLSAARREFDREEADRRLRDESGRALRQAMDAATRAIRFHEDGDDEPSRESGSESHGEEKGLTDRGRLQLRALQEAIATERDDHMAPLRLRLNEIARARFDLPDDVEPDLESVRIARRSRLDRARELQAELAGVERDLAVGGRVTASALSLERDLADRRDQAAAVRARAAAYRHAHAIVDDAYEAFKTTDEERLLDAISGHLEALSGGTLGPIEAARGLDEATIRSGDRALPLTSPPLSYGQLHTALLSVRMGAADFLAGLGVGLPLLIDDPFVHLDERSAAHLWAVLQRISEDRQVIVATQDRLVLDHLGVSPDLELMGSEAATGTRAVPDARRVEDGILDLWSDSAD